jgi:2-polyprenyl-3-methyl-5-hydroxy-6-metoxy-1,4-benzoquinol methylase
MRKAIRHIQHNAVLLDIGCHKGELLQQVKNKISSGTGIDPHCSTCDPETNIKLLKGMFPAGLPPEQKYDCITALALLEHIPAAAQPAFMQACYDALGKNGKLVLTVPDASVDRILRVLAKLKLIDGMSLEEHFGFSVQAIPALASAAGFKLLLHESFQLGLNNLFVFTKEVAS